MKCPGQDTQYWNADAIFETECPECGHPMEFFKDDATRRCPGCQKKMVNPKMDFGCAAYCQFAEQCLGTLPEEFVAQRDDLLKDRVAVEMKSYFGADFKRIGHAGKVARYAEQLGRTEKANLAVVLCAAYLRNIGIKNAEAKYPSEADAHVAIEGPSVARELLEKLGAKPPLIDAVCAIVGHHRTPTADDPIDLKVVYDADMLVNMSSCEKKKTLDHDAFSKKIDRLYLTESGRKMAKEILI